MSDKYIISKGTQFHWTDDSAHTVAPPTAAAALPTSFPIAADDATWKTFKCVEDITGLGEFMDETKPHRCLNASSPLVENIPTGFVQPTTITMTTSFDQGELDAMQAYVDDVTGGSNPPPPTTDSKIIRLMVVFSRRRDHVKPYVYAVRVKVVKASFIIRNGDVVGAQYMFEPIYDKGVRVLGAAS